jgi:hypothetical protein
MEVIIVAVILIECGTNAGLLPGSAGGRMAFKTAYHFARFL